MFQMLPMNIFSILMYEISSLFMLFILISLSKTIFVKELKNHKKKKLYKLKVLGLFSSFDPKTSIFEEMNWVSFFLPMLFLFQDIFSKPSRFFITCGSLVKSIKIQLSIALKTSKDSSSILFLSIFLMLLTYNMMGLLPNIFTGTSHLTVNLIISISLWTGFFMYGWTKYHNKMFAHLVPNGTPKLLISFMVLIELISTTIRPITLSIRLMANMISGHLLLTLMGNTMELSSHIMCLVLMSVQSLLAILEISVAFIQAYVYSILLTLYSDESDYKN